MATMLPDPKLRSRVVVACHAVSFATTKVLLARPLSLGQRSRCRSSVVWAGIWYFLANSIPNRKIPKKLGDIATATAF